MKGQGGIASGGSAHGMRETFLATLTAIQPVVAAPEVAARWNEPSVLAQFNVRGLAGHLIRAGVVVETYLDRPKPVDSEPISIAAYFAPIDSDVTAGANVAIRSRGEELAAVGQTQLVRGLEELVARLTSRLPGEPRDRPTFPFYVRSHGASGRAVTSSARFDPVHDPRWAWWEPCAKGCPVVTRDPKRKELWAT